jgi:hypothetical protein
MSRRSWRLGALGWSSIVVLATGWTPAEADGLGGTAVAQWTTDGLDVEVTLDAGRAPVVQPKASVSIRDAVSGGLVCATTFNVDGESWTIDPMLQSAHVRTESSCGLVDVEWVATGQLEAGDVQRSVGVGCLVLHPVAQVYASVGAGVRRSASATGSAGGLALGASLGARIERRAAAGAVIGVCL